MHRPGYPPSLFPYWRILPIIISNLRRTKRGAHYNGQFPPLLSRDTHTSFGEYKRKGKFRSKRSDISCFSGNPMPNMQGKSFKIFRSKVFPFPYFFPWEYYSNLHNPISYQDPPTRRHENFELLLLKPSL